MKNLEKLTIWQIESLTKFIGAQGLTNSKSTVDAYTTDLIAFMSWLSAQGVKRLSSLKSEHIQSYLEHCKTAGKSNGTINRYYSAIRAYCRFLRKTKAIDSDLTEDIQAPRNKQKLMSVPSKEEIEAILVRPNVGTEWGMRNRAILELLYSSGLRASELCNLTLKDFNKTSIFVACGKGEKPRNVPVTATAQYWIESYVEMYRGKKPGWLFLTKDGKKIRREFLFSMVVEYAKEASVESVTTHTLRHACATHLLEQGADITLIQAVLGHASIASTQRYTHLSTNKIQEKFHSFHPRKMEEKKEEICQLVEVI